ncbi:hypothetical protein VNO78_18081 [Psophocarpus tetragonolobus]|uniref:Uncharacterized protein n=1 Tax=Psophocarpus tetragonolobus TaxID=3891 RepID=A0AAN9SHQ3_PSOTE
MVRQLSGSGVAARWQWRGDRVFNVVGACFSSCESERETMAIHDSGAEIVRQLGNSWCSGSAIVVKQLGGGAVFNVVSGHFSPYESKRKMMAVHNSDATVG